LANEKHGRVVKSYSKHSSLAGIQNTLLWQVLGFAVPLLNLIQDFQCRVILSASGDALSEFTFAISKMRRLQKDTTPWGHKPCKPPLKKKKKKH